MKILQINKFLFAQGGAEHYLFSLTELLRQQGHQVYHWGMKKNPQPEDQHLLPYLDFSSVNFKSQPLKIINRMFYSRLAQRRLAALLKESYPQIVHLHNIYHQISPSILPVLKKHKIPIVMTVHDFKLICPNYSLFTKGAVCQRCKKYKYHNCLTRRCIKDSYFASLLVALEMYFHKLFKFYERYIDCFIAPSQFVKDKLVEFGQDSDKIKVVTHFAQVLDNQPAKKGEYLLYFGRLLKGKGVDLLLRAWSEVKTDWRLKVAGQGPQAQELKNLASNLDLSNVDFLGFLEQTELQKVIRSAQAVVVPSEMYETFGLVILETYARAVPVLASDQSSFQELVAVNKTGWLFKTSQKSDLVEKLQFLVNQDELLRSYGQKAYQLVKEKYQPGRHYQEIMAIYQSLLS